MEIDYDEQRDVLTIEGTRYDGSLFRQFGQGMPVMDGQLFTILSKEDGTVTIKTVVTVDAGVALSESGVE